MLAEVLTQVVIVVGFMTLGSTVAFVGRDRLAATRSELRSRLRTTGPIIAVLAGVLSLNRVMRQSSPDIGINMSETFYELEGEFILVFQAIATTEVTAYFSFVYVYGYTFLLVFPVVAYFALSDTVPFRRLLTAYALNYAIGVVLYILVIAYGPRNVFFGDMATILYDTSPEYQHLTREVNRSTNVFPSLHTSLSTTVAAFAYATRSEYPKWFPLAVVLAVSIIVSTMYLGLHWAIDVVAGLVLAFVSVALSRRLVGRRSLLERLRRLRDSD